MKTTRQLLDIQAYVDGELEAGQKEKIEQWLATDDEAGALLRELEATRTLVRAFPPDATVSDTREFYWSGISRRLNQAEQAKAAATQRTTRSPLTWLRWLVPALGVGAVAMALTFQRAGPTGLAVDFEASHSDTTTITFRSESDGITIHWLN